MTDLTPHTSTHYTTLPAPFPSAPGFAFQLTRLANTLFVWVGTLGEEEEKKKLAGDWAAAMPSNGVSLDVVGSEVASVHLLSALLRLLCFDTVQLCGPLHKVAATASLRRHFTDSQVLPATATPLFRTGASDVALPMSQRLGKCCGRD